MILTEGLVIDNARMLIFDRRQAMIAPPDVDSGNCPRLHHRRVTCKPNLGRCCCASSLSLVINMRQPATSCHSDSLSRLLANRLLQPENYISCATKGK